MSKATTKVGFSGCFTRPGGTKHFLAIQLPDELSTLLASSDRRRENAEEVSPESADQKSNRHNSILRNAVLANDKLLDAVLAAARQACPEGHKLTSVSIRGEGSPLWSAAKAEMATH